jgi:hypothetical protein
VAAPPPVTRPLRSRPPRVLVLAGALAVAAGGCYSTTRHRAEVATPAGQKACAAAVSEVFERSGFNQLPTPPNLSMFFAPRVRASYSSFLEFGTGIGVTIAADAAARGTCQVTLEALSPDAGCGDNYGAPSMMTCQAQQAGEAIGMERLPRDSSSVQPQCPLTPPLACELSYAPGADNDAAVDELARRLQLALGARARVDVRASASR